jgi:tetratricopeptide (TPR) repeat protein
MAADTPPQIPLDPEPVVLERDVPLSQSLIWRLQREFYVQRGLRAWTEDMVPNFLTNNPFIAEIYARIVFAFLCDCIESGPGDWRSSAECPLRILELGAGAGKFAYLFLRNLTSLLRTKGIAPSAVRYCITDCSESVVQSWRTNSYLAEFVECGMLEFELLRAGEEIKSIPAKGPLVVIANYVFDSLPQDVFVILEGKLSESLVSTAAPSRMEDGGSGDLKNLQLSYNNASVQASRYPDQRWNDILELYRTRLPAVTVLFPCAALNTFQKLSNGTDGRMLVLAADKGYAHEEDLLLAQAPAALEFHAPNCFSQMVNFDAIGKYFNAQGGEALVPDKHAASLNICAFIQRRPGDQFPATKAGYQAELDAFGPDDLFTLLAWLNAHMEEMNVPQILSALRLTRWDPVAFLRLFPVLARQIRSVSRERNDVRNAVMRVWANHYPVHPSENVLAFNCGVILLELRFFDDAFSLLQASQRIFGPSAATSYNLGLCSLGLGRPSEALAFMVEACDLDPKFEPARLSRQRLEDETKRD